jgi:hypothetical protein
MPVTHTAITYTSNTVDQTVSTVYLQLGALSTRTRPLTFVYLYVECPCALVRLRLERGAGDGSSWWAVALWGLFFAAGLAVGGSWLGCFAFQEGSMAVGGVREHNGIGVTPLTIFG